MADVTEQEKVTVVDFLKGKSAAKSKFYFNDFVALFPDKKPREVKKILTALVNEQVLEFWSSGSTTMYGLKGAGKQSHAEGED
ncbi:MAG: dissimilatory sulfite reductase D family protein [Desulfovibrio sp.]|nr:dissimilatory sulfite reductase D family protein [Desulfovibrio sp.]